MFKFQLYEYGLLNGISKYVSMVEFSIRYAMKTTLNFNLEQGI